MYETSRYARGDRLGVADYFDTSQYHLTTTDLKFIALRITHYALRITHYV